MLHHLATSGPAELAIPKPVVAEMAYALERLPGRVADRRCAPL
jgi:hypothetical protein